MIRPAVAVMNPITAMVSRMPTENISESPSCASCRHAALAVDESDDQRNTGQMTRAEQEAEDSPDQGGHYREEGSTFNCFGENAENRSIKVSRSEFEPQYMREFAIAKVAGLHAV